MGMTVTSTCNCFKVFAEAFFFKECRNIHSSYNFVCTTKRKIAESDTVLGQEYIHKKKDFLWILETYNEKNLE